jgi:hypothetical protein
MEPDPVRPGSSDALTARTIDATIHPPLVRAQETVAGIVPRLVQAAAPLTSPLFLTMFAFTIVFILIAKRMRYRPSALVLSALLVMTLTSFHPVVEPEPSQLAQVRTPKNATRGSKAWYRFHLESQPAEEPPQVVVESPPPEQPDPPEPPEAPDMPHNPYVFVLPQIPVDRLPEVSTEMIRSAERMMRDNEHMQRMMSQIRHRVREEMRRQYRRQMIAEREARSRQFDFYESPR